MHETSTRKKITTYGHMYCHPGILLTMIPVLFHQLYEAEFFGSQHIELLIWGNVIFARGYQVQRGSGYALECLTF